LKQLRLILRLSRPRKLSWLFGSIATILLLTWLLVLSPLSARSQVQVFDQVWKTVNENFYDLKFNGVDWAAQRTKYRPLISQASDSKASAEVINNMLGELKVSHTRFYTPDQLAYYQLLGIFQPDWDKLPKAVQQRFPNRRYEYTGIGTQTREINGQTFVSGVLEESPAKAAGIQVGDQLLRVNGQPYQAITSFARQAGKVVKLEIQRKSPPAEPLTSDITPRVYDTITMFAEAQKASTRIIDHKGKKLGYVHIWSNAAEPNQQQLRSDLIGGKLREADALILDLRDGWGGGTVDYLNVFTGKGPSITSINREGKRFEFASQWRKPVLLLFNQGSRSSKEIVAYGFKTLKLGPTVGTPTAGAVLAGRPYFMEDGSMLYLAVADVLVDGQQRLEGIGVTPDVTVPFELPYAQGADPQLERARSIAVNLRS
jgi:carboxyl-terminal processing protease